MKKSKAKVRVPLSATDKKTKVFFAVYIVILVLAFNIKILNNIKYAFNMLFGKINYWFVFSKDGSVVPLPDETDTETPLPNYPQPELEIPITSWGYWREVINALLRGAILAFVIIALIWLFIHIFKRLEIRNNKQTTIPYLVYTNTIKDKVARLIKAVDHFIAGIMQVLLNKKNITTMILLYFAVSGNLLVYAAGLTVSMYSLFITGPINWLWLHFSAIVYYTVVFISKFTAFNIFLTLFIGYNMVAFYFAYSQFKNNELKQEEFIDGISFGVGMAGGSGKGKTLTGKTLADASQRSAKKYVRKDNKDIENTYSSYVNFNDIRRFFDEHKNNIHDDIDASKYAEIFIEKYNVKNIQIDRFLGQTPDLHTQIMWYFIGLWILKPETRLIQSVIPMIINDNSSSQEVRKTIYDILTMRYTDVYAIKLDQNLIKSSLDNIESETDDNGKRIFKLKEGVEAEDINLSAHPALTVFWPELDKDFPFNERGAILEAKIDKLLGIFRHFTAFKQKTIGHFIYDSQQRDGVANIVRTKFDSVLKIVRQDKGKRSLFLIPYIRYIERSLKLNERIMDAMVAGSPYKKSFFRVFIENRIRRLNRINDYLHSFDYIDMYVTLVDAGGVIIDDGGKPLRRLRINLANAYFTFPSVVYQDPYKEAKIRFPFVKTVKELKTWESLQMKLTDINDIKSDFLGDVFLGEKKGKAKEKSKDKPKEKKQGKAHDNEWLL